MVAMARITCQRKQGVLPPGKENGFTYLGGDAGATLMDHDKSEIMLRPLSPITHEINQDTIDVIERYSLDPGVKPDGQDVRTINFLQTLSIKMTGWGFGPWCARPIQANVSLLVNGKAVWSKVKPVDEKSTLVFSLRER